MQAKIEWNLLIIKLFLIHRKVVEKKFLLSHLRFFSHSQTDINLRLDFSLHLNDRSTWKHSTRIGSLSLNTKKMTMNNWRHDDRLCASSNSPTQFFSSLLWSAWKSTAGDRHYYSLIYILISVAEHRLIPMTFCLSISLFSMFIWSSLTSVSNSIIISADKIQVDANKLISFVHRFVIINWSWLRRNKDIGSWSIGKKIYESNGRD